jgi:hypothetical protein
MASVRSYGCIAGAAHSGFRGSPVCGAHIRHMCQALLPSLASTGRVHLRTLWRLLLVYFRHKNRIIYNLITSLTELTFFHILCVFVL